MIWESMIHEFFHEALNYPRYEDVIDKWRLIG